tara:strand:- start:19 stop:318 length:300 start_codon:yes stop_codon:yes gene_type:complete
MAVNTDFTGNVKVFNSHGKALHITKLAKSNITQDELDAAIRFIQQTATVVAIADDTTGGFNAGASDAVHVLSEGVAPAAGSNFGIGSTGITSSVVAHFE